MTGDFIWILNTLLLGTVISSENFSLVLVRLVLGRFSCGLLVHVIFFFTLFPFIIQIQYKPI